MLKELEKIPWIAEKIAEVKTATTLTEKVLIPEVKIADKERALERTKSQASEKTAQEKEGTIDKVLEFLKDKVQSLVDVVQNLWSGVTQVKETSIQQSNAPESPVGQPTGSELLTAIMKEEMLKPDKSGANMLRWRRQSSKKKVNAKEERTLEAWDRAVISTEKVKKELE